MKKDAPIIAASACLLGHNCRYDGKNKNPPAPIESLITESTIPICPEILGGLPIPRAPSTIHNGNGFDVLKGKAKVIDQNGIDNTKAFIKGAYLALEIVMTHKVNKVILKGKSPSCGVKTIGVTAALFILKGILVQEV